MEKFSQDFQDFAGLRATGASAALKRQAQCGQGKYEHCKTNMTCVLIQSFVDPDMKDALFINTSASNSKDE